MNNTVRRRNTKELAKAERLGATAGMRAHREQELQLVAWQRNTVQAAPGKAVHLTRAQRRGH